MRILSQNELSSVSGGLRLVTVDVNVFKALGQVFVRVLAPFTKVTVNVDKGTGGTAAG